MSHVATHKTSIIDTNRTFLEQAVKFAAEDNHGVVCTEDAKVYDYIMGNPTKCEMAIQSDNFRPGVGLNVKNGALEFIGDAWLGGFKDIQNAVLQHYGVLGMRAAAAQEGYNLGEQNTLQNGDVLMELEVD